MSDIRERTAQMLTDEELHREIELARSYPEAIRDPEDWLAALYRARLQREQERGA